MIEVQLHGRPLGQYDPAANHRFTYTDEALKRGIPFSLSVPCQTKNHDGNLVKTSVANLVPDDHMDRQKLAEQAGLESSEPADLIRYYGRDCIGALQFFADEPEEPGFQREDEIIQLDVEDMTEIIDSLDSTPSGAYEGKPIKLSLAGTQSKVGLCREDDGWSLPTGRNPSTHLIKPPRNETYFDSHIVEYLTMEMADGLGLWVPDVDIEVYDGREVLVIERFDRTVGEAGSIKRIHQEDFARAMGRSPSYRYPQGAIQPGLNLDEIEDGTNKALKLIVNFSSSVLRDQTRFAKGLMVQWLLGSTDGHFKNYGLYLEKDGEPEIDMTPFYDLASTEPYNGDNPATDADDLTYVTDQGVEKVLDHRMRLAMPLGRSLAFDINAIHPGDFISLYDKPASRLDRDILVETLRSVYESIPEALDRLNESADSIPVDNDRLGRLLEPITAGVQGRSRRIRTFFE